MINNSMPFVGIVGGFWILKDDPALLDEARKTAREVGAALAATGLGLVVYFSNDESLEPHVVAGYVKALPPGEGAGSIRVRYAQSQRNIVKFAEHAMRKDVFELNLFPSDDWEAPFYRSLVAADGVDAVLLMAGARSTLIAGQIALGRRLPILAIDRFDGSAGVIRTELAISDKDYPSAATHSINEMVAWLKKKCDTQTEERAQARLRESRYLKVASQTEKAFWSAGAFLALLVTFFFGVGQPPEPRLYAFLTLVGLIAAGAMGAAVRSVIWGAEDTAPLTSLLLGGVAGFVAGLAYLVPQYVGKYGVLDPSETKVGATDKIQFISSVLVAISAGIGFDTVFDRLKERAKDQAVGPPADKR
jgi:hypothetical protein